MFASYGKCLIFASVPNKCGYISYYNVLVALLLILVLIPRSIVLYRLQGEAFDNLGQRSPLSREMNNYSDILLNREYAKELRLFRYGHYIQERYRDVFRRIYQSNCRMRGKEPGTSVLFFVLGGVFSTLAFTYAVVGAGKGIFGIGDVSLFASCIILANETLICMADDYAMLYDTVLFMRKYFSLLLIICPAFHSKSEFWCWSMAA